MKKGSFITLMAMAGIVLGMIAPQQSTADSITIDEIIYQPEGSLDVSALLAAAEMTYDGNVLSITLTNASNDTVATGSVILMTGLGFNLPSGVSIKTSGTHDASIPTGSSFYDKNSMIPSVPPSPLNEEWGYENAIDGGPFASFPAHGTINTATATLKASVEKDLNNGSPNSPNINGPSYGLLSINDDVSDKGGQEGIQDSILIQLQLTGSYQGDLLQFIDDQHVVASFGSPTASASPVPEPATFLLLSSGLVGLAGFRGRRFLKK